MYDLNNKNDLAMNIYTSFLFMNTNYFYLIYLKYIEFEMFMK